MKKLLKKLAFSCVMVAVLPLYVIGMCLLFVASLVTSLMCNWVENE